MSKTNLFSDIREAINFLLLLSSLSNLNSILLQALGKFFSIVFSIICLL